MNETTNQKQMIILAIETSCDETSVAVVKASGGLKQPRFEVSSNVVLSQIKIHEKWGGVVPSLAKREHQANLIPILKKSLLKAKLPSEKRKAKSEKQQLKIQNKIQKILNREPELLKRFLEFMPKIKPPKIDAIAVTVGPGLEPALWVGINFAKALSFVWNRPIIGVNHMEGHIVASLLDTGRRDSTSGVEFPAIALLVSGGHTELVMMKDWLNYKIIGETRDDAAGECFDKTARMLGLAYPGGPAIAKLALQCKLQITNHKPPIKLPRPMIDSKDYDFSFSGLKTAVLYLLKDLEKKIPTPFICKELQQAIIDVLIAKTIRAAREFGVRSIILGGGVAANKELRRQIKKAVASELTKTTALFLPPAKITTDNAAMIAAAGYLRAVKKEFTAPKELTAQGNLLL